MDFNWGLKHSGSAFFAAQWFFKKTDSPSPMADPHPVSTPAPEKPTAPSASSVPVAQANQFSVQL